MFTATLPARKSSKNSKIAFVAAMDNDFSPVAGVLTITTDRAECAYLVEESPSDTSARAFTLHKLGSDGTDETCSFYSVFCRAELPEITGCSCKGMEFKRTCKHADSVNELISSGVL